MAFWQRTKVRSQNIHKVLKRRCIYALFKPSDGVLHYYWHNHLTHLSNLYVTLNNGTKIFIWLQWCVEQWAYYFLNFSIEICIFVIYLIMYSTIVGQKFKVYIDFSHKYRNGLREIFTSYLTDGVRSKLDKRKFNSIAGVTLSGYCFTPQSGCIWVSRQITRVLYARTKSISTLLYKISGNIPF